MQNHGHVKRDTHTGKEVGWLIWYSDGLLAGWPGFTFWQGQEIYLHSTASRLALRPTQPPIQWVPAAVFMWSKRPGRKLIKQTPQFSVQDKHGGAMPPSSFFMTWFLINYAGGQICLYLTNVGENGGLFIRAVKL
jgi:hypothetical protein